MMRHMRWQYVRLFSTSTLQFSHDVGYSAELANANDSTSPQRVRAFDLLLDAMGADGWELVIVDNNDNDRYFSSTFYFKRAF
jgi:hypothetical protein